MMRTITQEKVELKKCFLSARSSDEMLKIIQKMESCFEEEELGLEYLTVSKQLLKDGFLEKVLFFGKRALSILLNNLSKNIPFFGIIHTCEEHSSSLTVAFALELLGNACFDLKMFDESLRYLNWANKNLSKIELDVSSSCGGQCILLHNLLPVQILLFKVKMSTGGIEESVVHLRKIVEIKEKVMEEGCIKIGEANKGVCEAYVMIGDSKEALPFCLKALEIYTTHFGRDSVEVAQIISGLVGIYSDLGECEKALELNKLLQCILKTIPCSPDSLEVEFESGKTLIEMGRYEEAITVLKRVISHTPTEGGEQAFLFVLMARAFCELKKFADARKYMKTACRIIEKKKMLSVSVASAYGDMSRIYEMMSDFEVSLSMLMIALAMPEMPLKLLPIYTTRFFSLVSLTEKEKEQIAYLEDLVERLKKDFGPNHREVGYSYARLGLAYLKLGQEELAVKFMVNAKDIMDVSLGPNHLDSLITSQMLSVTYRTMKSYSLALQLQVEVVEGLKGLGSSEQEFMDEAFRILTNLKEKVTESRTKAFESKDGKDLCTKISKTKCSTADDGTVTK